MTELPDEALKTHQHEVQRLLGRCLLRLQQYERQIKAIVAHHKISGPAHALEEVQTARIADTARKTLGALVGDLLGSYLVNSEIDILDEDTPSSPEAVASIDTRMHMILSEADYARTENQLKELVLLRNNLVHHFIDQHDIWTLDGCRSAHDALVDAYSRIDQHFGQLRELAEEMDQFRRLFAEAVQSDEVHDLVVNGINKDGTVDWPAAGIVSALREAAGALAVDGWASVAAAGRWIAERHPEQLPAKYGCSSWPQVVHESRLFEIRYFEADGQRSACYREKARPANSH